MGEIKVDVQYVLGEVKACGEALATLKEILSDFEAKYPTVLNDQVSNEFIKEFTETLDEMKENISGIVEEGTTTLIKGVTDTTTTFLEADVSIAKDELLGGK